MDVKKAIESRRSIRKYLGKPVPDELVESIIDAARLAPTGNNAQPGKYVIVKDPEQKKALKDKKIIRDEWAYDAPVIIVCCADPSVYTKFVEGLDDANEVRAIRDLSIASGFMVLRAQELGLGTCYVGWIKKEEIKAVLNIPQHYKVPYVITLGYPAESPEQRSRKNIDEIIL